MRYIKYLFLALIMLGLVLLALANFEAVTVTALPAGLATWVGWNFSLTLPLFAVILLSVVTGLVLGFLWEWVREHRHRATAKVERKERDALAREVETLRGKANEGQDEVLALLEN